VPLQHVFSASMSVVLRQCHSVSAPYSSSYNMVLLPEEETGETQHPFRKRGPLD
jgi:hypothetical protein